MTNSTASPAAANKNAAAQAESSVSGPWAGSGPGAGTEPRTASAEVRKDSGYAEDPSTEANDGLDTPSPTARAAPEPTEDELHAGEAGESTDEDEGTTLHTETPRPSPPTTSAAFPPVLWPGQCGGDGADRHGDNSETSSREVLNKVIEAFMGKKARKRRGKRKVKVKVKVQNVPPQLMTRDAVPCWSRKQLTECQHNAVAAGLPEEGSSPLEGATPMPMPVKVQSLSEISSKRQSICSCGSLDHGGSSNDISQRTGRPASSMSNVSHGWGRLTGRPGKKHGN